MAYNNYVKFGTLTLSGAGANSVYTISMTKVPGTLKLRQNEIVTFTQIPGRAKERRVTITGIFQGTNKDSHRTTLKNYDNGSVRRFEDGVHDGDYIIEPETLIFNDSADIKNTYPYSMVLREWKQ